MIWREHEPMAAHTTFKIGGEADVLAEGSADDLRAVRARCLRDGTPLTVIGGGANLLVHDAGVRGVVFHLLPEEPAVHGTHIVCGAGTPLKALCLCARDHGLSGLEFAYGIPGTVGGAVWMNAGAYGGEMKDVLVSVGTAGTAETALISTETSAPADSAAHIVTANHMDLTYRHSIFMDTGEVILSAEIALTPDDPAAIDARMQELLTKRKEKQPLEFPSAGSYFKRPPGGYAGTLIEAAGLKGFAVGGAAVSDKHAGFIINKGGATCADVLALEDAVRRRVFEHSGVLLEREVRLL
ncbi:MAG: UDP-N-acetylmuramate dehydrogenase [Oscillospiraceae bacterium]|nr:UDP-N-acetylmuramate dehydrogenase [Oscillospiraceae bacterium]